MILRPVRPASPSGPPMTNLPVGLTCQTVSLRDPALGQGLADIGLDDLAHVGRGQRLVEMLGREHDLGDADRLAVLVLDRDLALGVGAELGGGALAGLARIGEHLEDLVGVVDRRRQQFRRLAAGIAEHDALVAGAVILVAGLVDALRDVGRLRVQQHVDLGLLPVEAVLLVADRLDRLARGRLDLRLDLLVGRGACGPRRR